MGRFIDKINFVSKYLHDSSNSVIRVKLIKMIPRSYFRIAKSLTVDAVILRKKILIT